jgi:hypothetical protein
MEPIGKTMTRPKAQSTPSLEKKENISSLCFWRPFGKAEDRLGATKFLEVVLSSISRGASNLPPFVRGDSYSLALTFFPARRCS